MTMCAGAKELFFSTVCLPLGIAQAMGLAYRALYYVPVAARTPLLSQAGVVTVSEIGYRP
jgi:hypothetical protein